MKVTIIISLFLLLISCTNEEQVPYKFSDKKVTPSKAAVYDTDWRPLEGHEIAKISQVITTNNIKGCGTMYVKKDGEQYLVACYSFNSKEWRYYEIEFRDNIGQLSEPKATSKKFISTPDL